MNEYQYLKLPRYARMEIDRLRADVLHLETQLYSVTTRVQHEAGVRLLVDPYPESPERALPWGTHLRWAFSIRDYIEVHAEKDAALVVRASDRVIVEPRSSNAFHVDLRG